MECADARTHTQTLTITFNISEIAMHHVGEVHQIGALGQAEEDEHEDGNVRGSEERCHLLYCDSLSFFPVIAGNFGPKNADE